MELMTPLESFCCWHHPLLPRLNSDATVMGKSSPTFPVPLLSPQSTPCPVSSMLAHCRPVCILKLEASRYFLLFLPGVGIPQMLEFGRFQLCQLL